VKLVAKAIKADGVIDPSKLGAESLFFLPRCPPEMIEHARVIDIPGKPISTKSLYAKAAELQAAEDAERRRMAEEARERANAKAAERRAAGFTEADQPIDKLREVMPKLTDAMQEYGYRYFKRQDRWLHPSSTTGVPGIMVFTGDDGIERMISFHGCDSLEQSLKTFGTVSHDVVDFVIAQRWGTGPDAMKTGIATLCKEYGIVSSRSTHDPFFGTKAEAEDFSKAAGAGSDALKNIWNPWAEHAVPKFPLDVLPPAIASYVEARAIETGACMSAIAMSVLTTISSAITHEAKVYLKPGKNFPAGPRLWTAIIGPPSSKKSPAIEGSIKPLIKEQKAIQAMQMAAWRQRKEEDPKNAPARPELTKYVDYDMTPEAVVDILSYQERGMLLVADELSGFLTSFDRYGAGKGAAAGRAVWLQAYNGGYYAASRVSRVVAPVNNLSVSILGGIQMDRLRELGSLTSDGLLQRFLPVLMSKPALDSNSFDHGAWAAWRDAVRGLLAISRFSTELESDGQRERQRIAEFIFNLGQVESEGAAWQGFVGKMPGVWGSLALIMHCVWEGAVGTNLKAENARRASRLVEEFLLPHGLAFYREISGGSQADNRNIAGFLAGFDGPIIKVRDFTRGPRCCRGVTPEEIVKKLQPFEAGGWLQPKQAGLWNREWQIRPGLSDAFCKQLARHREVIAAVQDRIKGLSDDEE
jgi:hypothetical protein